jgi:alpha/beta superfamily hydrolase
METDVNPAKDPLAVAVLLHPHPDFGGSRFHPFIDGMFHRLPDISVTSIRFDFTSADMTSARAQVVAAIDEPAVHSRGLPAVIVGYSFGAGVAASVTDSCVAARYLLAPPLAMLEDAVIADDPRPKAVVIPERDQFSPPASVAEELWTWRGTTFATIPGVDHFLGHVGPIVDNALAWIGKAVAA